jgi:hypothetical protein
MNQVFLLTTGATDVRLRAFLELDVAANDFRLIYLKQDLRELST